METSHEPTDKLFEYVVGPTRERYSRMRKQVCHLWPQIMEEGAHLVQRFYVAEGFLDAVVDPPRDKFQMKAMIVDVTVPIHEGRQYFLAGSRLAVRWFTMRKPCAARYRICSNSPYTDVRVGGHSAASAKHISRRAVTTMSK